MRPHLESLLRIWDLGAIHSYCTYLPLSILTDSIWWPYIFLTQVPSSNAITYFWFFGSWSRCLAQLVHTPQTYHSRFHMRGLQGTNSQFWWYTSGTCASGVTYSRQFHMPKSVIWLTQSTATHTQNHQFCIHCRISWYSMVWYLYARCSDGAGNLALWPRHRWSWCTSFHHSCNR